MADKAETNRNLRRQGAPATSLVGTKRGRSEGSNPPSLSKPPKITKNRGNKKTKPSTLTGETFSEAVTALKMGVVSAAFPEEGFTEQQFK